INTSTPALVSKYFFMDVSLSLVPLPKGVRVTPQPYMPQIGEKVPGGNGWTRDRDPLGCASRAGGP
ncbi:MAG TPA: hypothetical protein VK955_13105, partial [Xanthobacteraceae bacterium]|nr:hypothetical protein [Xanthobacteraceae bacterium]